MPTTKTAADYRNEAQSARERAHESFERCDTDGFLSQWASGLNARLADRKAAILENDGKDTFVGLYDGDRRVKARLIETRFGTCWLLHEDETGLISRRKGKFVPTGKRSRIQKRLGLRECEELAPAWAKFEGRGTGLSGSCWVASFRTGDKWGQDATRKE